MWWWWWWWFQFIIPKNTTVRSTPKYNRLLGLKSYSFPKIFWKFIHNFLSTPVDKHEVSALPEVIMSTGVRSVALQSSAPGQMPIRSSALLGQGPRSVLPSRHWGGLDRVRTMPRGSVRVRTRLVGQIWSGVWVSVSFQKKLSASWVV